MLSSRNGYSPAGHRTQICMPPTLIFMGQIIVCSVCQTSPNQNSDLFQHPQIIRQQRWLNTEGLRIQYGKYLTHAAAEWRVGTSKRTERRNTCKTTIKKAQTRRSSANAQIYRRRKKKKKRTQTRFSSAIHLVARFTVQFEGRMTNLRHLRPHDKCGASVANDVSYKVIFIQCLC